MSHADQVSKIPKNFKRIAYTDHSPFTFQISNENIFGIQFHPEVTHTLMGKTFIKNFIFLICKIKKNWKIMKKIELLKKFMKPQIRKSYLCFIWRC